MSIVAAITDGTRAWIGSDTLTTRGDDVGFKGIRWRGGALGITGELFALQAFRYWLEAAPPPSDPVELSLHLRDLARSHKMGYWYEGTMTLEFAALYVRPSEMWHIGSDFSAVQCPAHSVQAIGGGNETADGALWGAQRVGKRFKTLRVALKFALEAAIAKCNQCGGEAVIHRVR